MSGLKSGKHLILDSGQAQLVGGCGPARPITAAAFSPDGSLVATIDDQGWAKVWMIQTGQFYELQGDSGPEASMLFQEHSLRVMVRTKGGVRVERIAIPGHVPATPRTSRYKGFHRRVQSRREADRVRLG